MGRRVRPAAGPTEIKNKTQLGSFVHAPAGTRIRVSLLGRGPVEGLMFASSRAAVAANAMSEDDTLILHGEKPIWLFEGQPRVVTTGYSNPITVLGAAASPVDAAAMGAAGAASLRAALGERGIGGGGGGGPRRLDLAPVPPVRGGEGGGEGPSRAAGGGGGGGPLLFDPASAPFARGGEGGGEGPSRVAGGGGGGGGSGPCFFDSGPVPPPQGEGRGEEPSRGAGNGGGEAPGGAADGGLQSATRPLEDELDEAAAGVHSSRIRQVIQRFVLFEKEFKLRTQTIDGSALATWAVIPPAAVSGGTALWMELRSEVTSASDRFKDNKKWLESSKLAATLKAAAKYDLKANVAFQY